MTTSDPAPERTDAWGAILAFPIGDRRAWPMGRTALLIADRALALMPATPADVDRERLREAIAAEAYWRLRDYDAVTYPQTPPDQQVPVCIADPDEIRQWLTVPVHDQDQHNLAHYLDLDNAWHASAPDIAVRLAPLLREVVPRRRVLWCGSQSICPGSRFSLRRLRCWLNVKLRTVEQATSTSCSSVRAVH